ncbi:MAG: hypothetical protein IJ313_05055 [Clostridia bacterium]|nr:hypothetical protein [Clostridia bacterium]
MKKSEIYRTAIAAVIDNGNLDMEIKIDVLRELCDSLGTAEYVERRDGAEGAA